MGKDAETGQFCLPCREPESKLLGCVWDRVGNQLILLFSLFLLLFMNFTTLFSIIYKSTISVSFYPIYSIFSKKISISTK